MFAELRELLRSGAIRRHQLGPKYILTLASSSYHFSGHPASYEIGSLWKSRQRCHYLCGVSRIFAIHLSVTWDLILKMNLLFIQFRKFKKMNIHNEK